MQLELSPLGVRKLPLYIETSGCLASIFTQRFNPPNIDLLVYFYFLSLGRLESVWLCIESRLCDDPRCP